MKKKDELKQKEKWLPGVIDVLNSTQGQTPYTKQLDSIADELSKASNNVCGAGFYGCHGGDNCSSSHK